MIQAAGHEGASQAEGVYIKPSTTQEIRFYESLASSRSPLAECVPEFLGTLTEGTGGPLLVMEDLCDGFTAPNVLDVKLGKILFDENASFEKQQRLKQVASETTSGTLGFRIAGMSVMESGVRKHYGKQFGRDATKADVSSRLARFWPGLDNEYVEAVKSHVVERIEWITQVLEKVNIEMRSSSILILYEGDLNALKSKINRQSEEETDEESSVIAEVRLIDFAHTKWATSPDADVIYGLHELVKSINSIEP